jgi:hypothetical protein
MAEKRVKEKPFTLTQLRQIYEMAMPDLLKERKRHLALLRGGLDDTQQSWFPEWSEADAEYSYEIAVHLRNYFDPDLKQAFRWAVMAERTNPQARQQLKKLHYAHSRVIEISHEWKDMSLLSFAIVKWNVFADQLIRLWATNEGLIKGG